MSQEYRFHQLALGAKRFDETAAWYRRHFGFTVAKEWSMPAMMAGASHVLSAARGLGVPALGLPCASFSPSLLAVLDPALQAEQSLRASVLGHPGVGRHELTDEGVAVVATPSAATFRIGSVIVT